MPAYTRLRACVMCRVVCPDHPERPGRVRAIMNALTRNYPDMRTLLAPEATVEQVRCGGAARCGAMRCNAA